MTKKPQYYYLSWTEEDVPGIEAAKAPKGMLWNELIKDLQGKNELPFSLILDDAAKICDYLPNTLAWPLMSQKLMKIISDSLTGKEGLAWVKAKIRYRGQVMLYYIPRFTNKLDILDMEKTMFAGDENEAIVKAHLSLSKIREYSFFPLPDWLINCSNIVSEDLKRKILDAGVTGVQFSKVPAS